VGGARRAIASVGQFPYAHVCSLSLPNDGTILARCERWHQQAS
jgi:hypothetical protein